MVGSFFGSFFISRISDSTMYLVSGLSMFFLVISSLKKYDLHRTEHISKMREYTGYLSYLILSVLGNLFPAGSGIWYYFANTLIFRLSPLESKGIASFVSIFWFLGTLAGIVFSGFYDLSYALALGLGMII